MTDYTTGLEALVFLVALMAMIFSVWSLFVSRTDQLVMRALQQNGVKHLTLNARLVRDAARVCCAAVMLTAASVCLAAPPDHDDVTIVLKVAVLLTSLFLTVAVVMDFRWRRRIDKALAELEKGKP